MLERKKRPRKDIGKRLWKGRGKNKETNGYVCDEMLRLREHGRRMKEQIIMNNDR